jgi:nitrile hydratase subunit beta
VRHPADLPRTRNNDLGGLPAGPIDRSDHAAEPWHKLVTAILGVVGPGKLRLVTIDEMRRAMEDMPADDYRRLGYFDKWAVGVSTLVVEKGLMTRDEVDARIADLRVRLKAR